MDAGQHAAPKDSGSWAKVRNFILSVAVVIGLAYVTNEYIVDAYAVPSGSMESTIQPGDRVCVEHVSYYFRDVAPEDVITFDDPEIPGRTLLKRCIAVGGQTVDLKQGIVYIDGEPLSEPYTEGRPTNPLNNAKEEITYPYTVPEGTLWVMGDNRTNSQDSRYFGPIDVSSVQERVFVVAWPFDHAGIVE